MAISLSHRVDGRWAFMKEFLKHPLEIGSCIPSSRFLEQKIVEMADIGSAKVVVELGSGTGGITRALLQVLPQQATLLSIEINPHLHGWIRHIDDARLLAHLGSASDLKAIIATYQLEAPEVVISGIPFSTMSGEAGTHILAAVSSLLPPNGRFVAYQVSRRIEALCRPIFGEPTQRTLEFRNIPPMRIFLWTKTDTPSRNLLPHSP